MFGLDDGSNDKSGDKLLMDQPELELHRKKWC